MEQKRRLIVAISGASGAVYGVRLLEYLQNIEQIDVHLVISKAAGITIKHELARSISSVTALADFYYQVDDISAPIASGSFRTDGMVIAPCSVKTMSEIASGVCGNLLTRAADVVLKEQKRLVLMVRESPLHLGHLENMSKLTRMGAVIAPPLPAFYHHPETIDQLVDHSLGRVLDLFDIESDMNQSWQGLLSGK